MKVPVVMPLPFFDVCNNKSAIYEMSRSSPAQGSRSPLVLAGQQHLSLPDDEVGKLLPHLFTLAQPICNDRRRWSHISINIAAAARRGHSKFTKPTMATALDTSARQQVTLSAQEIFALLACPLCSLHFDEAARMPRLLHCGHTFCSACVQARVEPKSARKWRVACAVCAHETPVEKGDASKLGKNHNTAALVAQLKVADFMPFRIHIKTMAASFCHWLWCATS